jgi:riboflavin synthase alpha subunit
VVNLEADIIAKYVENYSKTPRSSLTMEMLRENGFV